MASLVSLAGVGANETEPGTSFYNSFTYGRDFLLAKKKPPPTTTTIAIQSQLCVCPRAVEQHNPVRNGVSTDGEAEITRSEQ